MINKTLGYLKSSYWKLFDIEHVTTTFGHERCDKLRKVEGCDEDHRAKADWVEYYNDKDELVHRSVTIAIKQGVDLGGTQGDFNG